MNVRLAARRGCKPGRFGHQPSWIPVRPTSRTAPIEHFDVLIVGAGLSGIGAAWHLQKRCPGKSYAILEGREASGGTWDLFRYPGVRSDSDMYTLGYRFRPWKEAKAIADGPSILKYIREVASDHGIDRQDPLPAIGSSRASWSTPDARWTVEVERGRARASRRASPATSSGCAAATTAPTAGYLPEFPGIERFKGRIVHPQKWTDDIDYAGKKVVVIGSGATAVTLVPAMADGGAEHVTMLQRSPTYMAVRPSQDPFATKMRRACRSSSPTAVTRWKNVLLGMYFYQMCKRKPDKVKSLLLGYVRQDAGAGLRRRARTSRRATIRGTSGSAWCPTPISSAPSASGKVSVVTDHIETFTETGIRLKSGAELEADLIVTATGLVLVPVGGAKLTVDGRAGRSRPRRFIYKGMMYSDVPNLASVFGYTNASWTLKADLVCEYVCRLLNHMDRRGYRQCTPRNGDPTLQEEPWVNFSSGYIQRALAHQPKQGSKRPWKLYQNYALDLLSLRFGAAARRAWSSRAELSPSEQEAGVHAHASREGPPFKERHAKPGILILPNPWDAGTAKLLQSLGFEALATTSLGMSNALGRADGEGSVSRAELIENCRVIAEATDLPVNADLENGYADDPKEAATILRDAAEVGIVGGSIEDWSGEQASTTSTMPSSASWPASRWRARCRCRSPSSPAPRT